MLLLVLVPVVSKSFRKLALMLTSYCLSEHSQSCHSHASRVITTIAYENSVKTNYDKVFENTLVVSNAGFEFGFDTRSCVEVTPEEREAYFKECCSKGRIQLLGRQLSTIFGPTRKPISMPMTSGERTVLPRLTRPEMIELLGSRELARHLVRQAPLLGADLLRSLQPAQR